MRALRVAFAFLTRWPVGAPDLADGDAGAATALYPLVGLALGAVAAGAQVAATTLWGPDVGGLAAVATLAASTGALHLDGVGDCFDGLGVQGDRERRLAVMHDPRLGGLGVVGLVLVLGAQVTLAAHAGPTGLVVAAVLARAPVAAELLRAPAATPGKGLYGWLSPQVRPRHAVVAGVLGVAALGLSPARGVLALVLCAGFTLAWHRLWARRIGGTTGDVVGAAIELRQLLVLAAFAASVFGLPTAGSPPM